MNYFSLHKKSCQGQRASVFSSRSGLWLWMTFITWTFSLFIKNHVRVNVQVFSQVVVFSSQGCLIVYLQILDIRSCMQVFFPCFLPPKKTYDVYQNIYWIIYWNQISGLVTHQAHHAQGCLSSKYWKPIMIFNVEISYQVLQHITLIPPHPHNMYWSIYVYRWNQVL